MRPLKLDILQFSKSISSGIFNVSWQMTIDSETMEQYLNLVRTRFLISVLVFVSCDYELATKFRLIVVYLLRKNMEIEVSAFGNFSTDTGSTDCKRVQISEELTVNPANFCIFILCTFCTNTVMTFGTVCLSIDG